MEKTRTQAECVDLLKLIFAFCVVAIHTQAADAAPVYLQIWTAMAIPFFFVCSGYYLQMKLNALSPDFYRGGVKNYFKRLLRPFVIWGSWHLLLEAANRLLLDHINGQDALLSLGKRLLVSSPGGGLWYVWAILWMLGILYYLNNRDHCLSVFTLILSILYVFNVVITECADTSNAFLCVKQKVFPEEYNNTI